MKIILFILFSVMSFITTAQNVGFDTTRWNMEIYDGDTVYFKKQSKGDLARDKGDLKGAVSFYEADMVQYPDEKDIIYNMACAYALMHKKDSAFHYLNIATEQDTNVWALVDADFYFLMKDSRWAVFEDEMVAKIESRYGGYNNLALSKELWRMHLKDQAFYYHIDIAETIGGRSNPTINALWELKHIINTENVTRLEEIIATYGWPAISDVGGNAASAVFLIIQHADLEVQKKYLPMMTAAADKGEADWSSLALLIDRINLREGKQQVYGSQIGIDEDGIYYVDDLIEPEYVNQRRAEVGLGSIQEYVSMWGIEWTIAQKTK